MVHINEEYTAKSDARCTMTYFAREYILVGFTQKLKQFLSYSLIYLQATFLQTSDLAAVKFQPTYCDYSAEWN